jgi:hypothetical protein
MSTFEHCPNWQASVSEMGPLLQTPPTAPAPSSIDFRVRDCHLSIQTTEISSALAFSTGLQKKINVPVNIGNGLPP